MEWKTALQIAIPLLTALAGGAATSLHDVTGAKAWQNEQAEKIAHARMLETRVVALEAQQTILLELVGRCRQ